MSEIIIKQQDLNKAKRAVALSSMIHDLSILRKFVKELKTERKTANLANLLEKYKTMDYLEVCRGVVRALEQISKDDLDNIVFLGSSYDLESLVDGNQSSKLKFLKEHWKYESSAHVAMFYNPKDKILYPVYTGIFGSEYKDYVDVALCGKQNLEKNIDINNIPKAKYSDEVFKEIYGDDINKSKEIDNITPDNFLDYDPKNYFIKRLGLTNKNSYNFYHCYDDQEDVKSLFSFFESKAISKAAVDSYMLEKLLLGVLELQADKINKKERICFSFGGNTGLICGLFDTKKNGLDKSKSECITVNGLELSPLTKEYFKNKLGQDEFNKQQSEILKIRGTLDPVSAIETDVSGNTIFFETDNNMHNPHGAYSIMTNKSPTGAVYRTKFYSYFFKSIKEYISMSQENNSAYETLRAVFMAFNGNFIFDFLYNRFDRGRFIKGLFIALRAGIYACINCLAFVFSKKKNKQEIKIIDTPEKEKFKEEDHNHNEKNGISKNKTIPKMDLNHENSKAIE